ncbi:MAG TPA: hypothetical protein VFB45_04505 [Pseudolabrys sp.]|nr:hypothetical protein [Pseudolabrys sp.]
MAKRPAKAKASTGKARKSETARGTCRKLIEFDPETWDAIDLLARDRMMTMQEVTEEAFRDLLRKHGRPVDLKDALRKSAKKR